MEFEIVDHEKKVGPYQQLTEALRRLPEGKAIRVRPEQFGSTQRLETFRTNLRRLITIPVKTHKNEDSIDIWPIRTKEKESQ